MQLTMTVTYRSGESLTRSGTARQIQIWAKVLNVATHCTRVDGDWYITDVTIMADDILQVLIKRA